MPVCTVCPAVSRPVASPLSPPTEAAPPAPVPCLDSVEAPGAVRFTAQHPAMPLLAAPRATSQNATSDTSALAPAWLQIGFASLDFDGAAIRALLSQGRPFACDVDAKLTQFLGGPFRAGGIEALFAKAWPSAVWVASYEEVDTEFDMPRFTLSALDRLGKVIFDVNIGFMRCPDGAIDMHAAGADVDVEHRKFGITAYAELLREKILQAYSAHPQSRLSLQASHAPNSNTGATQAASGFFLHALRGYMLSDSQNVPSLPYPRNTPDGDADRDLSQLALLAKYFKRWAQKHHPQMADFECAALTSVCAQPYDYTLLTVAGQPIGQAYLCSGEAPAWYGVHFVNPPEAVTAAGRAAAQRLQSRHVWDKQLGHEIASAQKRCLGVQQRLWQQVHHADAATRAEGYIAIAMRGPPALVDFLQGRFAQETAPGVREALQDAIARVRGEKVNAGLRQAARDARRPESVREEMRQRLLARGASDEA